jgi:hypothetical protein
MSDGLERSELRLKQKNRTTQVRVSGNYINLSNYKKIIASIESQVKVTLCGPGGSRTRTS